MRDIIRDVVTVLIVGAVIWFLWRMNSQIAQMQQAWMDSNQAVINVLNYEENLDATYEKKVEVIRDYKDSCLDQPLPVDFVRVFPLSTPRSK